MDMQTRHLSADISWGLIAITYDQFQWQHALHCSSPRPKHSERWFTVVQIEVIVDPIATVLVRAAMSATSSPGGGRLYSKGGPPAPQG